VAELIAADDVMRLVVAACPSFGAVWDSDEHVDDRGRILYLDIADFARHVTELIRRSEVEELPAVADLIEKLHVEGDGYVRELATIGFLEALHPDDAFVPWLQPESRRWWNRLNRFWNGDETALLEVDDP
jgi:hypothetical protein